MSDKYILNEAGDPVPENDLMAWGRWFQGGIDRRRIARDEIAGVTISTVFLGLDHSYGDERPLLFETLVMGGALDQDMWRYSTRAEALEGHAKAVERVRAAENVE